MQNNKFKLRRGELLKQIGANGIAIVFAAKEYIRNGSEYYPYRQNSDFYYLTGFTESESIAVFISGRTEGEFVLFNRKRDAVKELWHGLRAGQEGACRNFGADQAFSIEEVDALLPQLLVDREYVYFNIGSDRDFDSRIDFWINQAGSDGAAVSHKLINIGEVLHEMRLKKTLHELELMRKAVEITAAGHLRAMRKCRPGMYEFELESELMYEFMRLGGLDKAFQTVVGGGANACTLHYSKNTDKLIDGDLVLIDAGVEYKYYCADVTRTFPINGKFTLEQRAIYEAVLTAQLEVINQIHPGIKFDSLQLLAERIITEHLVSLGLLKGKVEDLVARQAFKPFFMHKIGHWLGLDVHDVGKYQLDDTWRILEPGMVLTVEPGIYIMPNTLVDDKWLNIGIRIEDDILVTENGCDVLTKMIPKTIAEIETTMRKF
ncbi:Xaa-Pro aminopeptidase [Gammaproteobacteria bacterium]